MKLYYTYDISDLELHAAAVYQIPCLYCAKLKMGEGLSRYQCHKLPAFTNTLDRSIEIYLLAPATLSAASFIASFFTFSPAATTTQTDTAILAIGAYHVVSVRDRDA
jgi:hypothetical protein